jgi:hypothetical protein
VILKELLCVPLTVEVRAVLVAPLGRRDLRSGLRHSYQQGGQTRNYENAYDSHETPPLGTPPVVEYALRARLTQP